MAKYSFKHYLKRLPHVKTWQLIVVVLLLSLVSATLLRLNNIGMVERRTAVLSADEKGDKAEIKKSLLELQGYISAHMNTKMNGGIYLSESYTRDRDAALEAAQTTSNPNSAVYQQASVECRARWHGGTDSFRNDYVQCVIEKVSSLSSAADPVASVKLPLVDNYRYDFSPPLWSPDVAGLFVALTGVIILIILVRLITAIILHLVLKQHYQTI